LHDQKQRHERKQGYKISPTKFSKILVAVDGSEESFKAAQYAMDLAKKDKAQLIALTVNETAFLSVIEPSALEKWRKNINIQSETFFNRISTYGLDIDSQVQLRAEIIDSAQSAYAAIVDYAEKENVDLIVIGTREKLDSNGYCLAALL
jgi:nucleotide-binding universal stress UspA family protein